MPRTRRASNDASTRSTRSSKSHRSMRSTDSVSTDWTQASSVSQGNASVADLVVPAPTPESARTMESMDDEAEEGQLAQHYVHLVHMDRMARCAQSAEMQQGLESLLRIVKYRDGGDDSPGYQSALSELDYLEGLFKKLRFSYKEQLTKETVVRRVLELELPLLSAADIDGMVRTTETERGRLRDIKATARQQGTVAEALVRDLAAERLYVAMAEAETISLPARMLELRQRLVRMKMAIRAELEAVDRVGRGGRADARADPVSSPGTTYWCITCSSAFRSEPFYKLHQALHNVPRQEQSLAADAGGIGLDAAPAFPMRKCRACDQQVPTLFVDSASADETHEQFHARLQREVARAEAALRQMTAMPHDDDNEDDDNNEEHDEGGRDDGYGDLELPDEDSVEQLQMDDAAMEEMVARVRAEAARQAAVEKEMAELLRRLRGSVSGIRQEMARIEEDAGHMVECIEEGRTYMGRSLQEQADLMDLLMDD